MAVHHSAVVISARQVQRIRSGRLESVPADYVDRSHNPETRRQVRARRAYEERQVLRELGLLDG